MKFYAKARCGCCTIEMNFKDEESAKKAFVAAGLEATEIVDDDGVRHESVDMFYSPSFSVNPYDKPLAYLMGHEPVENWS
jgi:hypothetical protein